jgi:hypothetical protein
MSQTKLNGAFRSLKRQSSVLLNGKVVVSNQTLNSRLHSRRITRELFKFTIDEGKIEPFLEKRGLKIINHLDNREIEKTFLLNEYKLLIGQINGAFRFAMASPNTKS